MNDEEIRNTVLMQLTYNIREVELGRIKKAIDTAIRLTREAEREDFLATDNYTEEIIKKSSLATLDKVEKIIKEETGRHADDGSLYIFHKEFKKKFDRLKEEL